MSLSKREKRFVAAGIIVFVVVLSVKLVAVPLIERGRLMEASVQAKENLLKGYRSALKKKPMLEMKRHALRRAINELDAGFFYGETPTIASAELQSILGKIAKKEGVTIKTIKTFKPEVFGDYQKIQVEIRFISDIRALLNFIYDVENYNKALSIVQMDVALQGLQGQPHLRTIMKVEAGTKNYRSALSLAKEAKIDMGKKKG